MTVIAGSAAVVTGAANGIGEALCRELVERGCDVALVDIDRDNLERLAAEFSTHSDRRVTIHVVDVADKAQMTAFSEAVLQAHPTLNILINNAGVALYGVSDEIDIDDMEWLININFWGVVYASRLLLPHLSRQREAHIVNVASIFGLIAPPGQTAYSASKFAVRGFSEALLHELKVARSSVRLSVVYPSGIRTALAGTARVGRNVVDRQRISTLRQLAERLQNTTPRVAATQILNAVERNHSRIRVGTGSVLIDLIQRCLPGSYFTLMGGPLRDIYTVKAEEI
jgi:short-subunit dehydrogenase